jgi:hypothetical protein
MNKNTKFFNVITKVSMIFIIIILVAFIGVTIYKVGGPHLTEGYVIDKNVYPPVNRQLYPSFSITVQLNGTTDNWFVPESYYNSVHVGDYVRK